MPLLDDLKTHNLTTVQAALVAGESPNAIFESEIHEFSYATTTIAGFCFVKMTPLIYAIDNRLEDIALLLLDNGAEPNPEGVFVHPLNLACKHGFERVVDKLLEKKAHFNSTDMMHDTPILEAIKAAMLARDPATGELTDSSMKTTKNIITSLIKSGVRLNPEDETTFDAQTPIYQAAINNPWTSKQLIDLLMDLGATIDLHDGNNIYLLEYLADSQLQVNLLPPPPDARSGMINMARESSVPEYMNNEPLEDGLILTLYILERYLIGKQCDDIGELENIVEEVQVTDKGRNPLPIVTDSLSSTESVITEETLVDEDVDKKTPIARTNNSPYSMFRPRCIDDSEQVSSKREASIDYSVPLYKR